MIKSDKQYVIIMKTGQFFKVLHSIKIMFSSPYKWNYQIDVKSAFTFWDPIILFGVTACQRGARIKKHPVVMKLLQLKIERRVPKGKKAFKRAQVGTFFYQFWPFFVHKRGFIGLKWWNFFCRDIPCVLSNETTAPLFYAALNAFNVNQLINSSLIL